jgi:Na+-translocating ferredoxin:NAD+ oxidoreductase RnfG subunit
MEPITFITVISPEGTVRQVEIMVYRESIGSEVRDHRFLGQYKDKTAEHPLRVGKDVANISGATLSARAVSLGVKRALVLWDVFYGSRR